MSLLASMARPLWRLLNERNIDADALFRQHGLDPGKISQPRTRYAFDKLCDLWVNAAALTGREHIGLDSARYFNPLDLNALGVTFLSSANLREALLRVQRFEGILNSRLSITVREGEEFIDVICEVAELPEHATTFVSDSRTCILVHLARQGMDYRADAAEVAFPYAQPADTGAHFESLRCPLVFDHHESRISFRTADAKRPFSDANRELALTNDRFLDEMLAELGESDLVNQVKRAIIDALPSGAPSEDDIARQVYVSGRTLQRRLAEEGTSFRTLLLEVRRELAERYISDPHMPLAEISYMLGFADSSSFSRAFKRWTGEPPALFREKLFAER